MHKIYENIYIGTFIYLMGVVSERKRKHTNLDSQVSMSLYQQTPYDPYIGDFFGSLDGKTIIIEFKKDFSSIDSEEINKQYLLKVMLEEQYDNDLIELSQKCHFLGVGENTENNATILFTPYIEIPESSDPIPMIDFIDEYCSSTSDAIGYSGNLIAKYISILASMHEERRSSGSGALIVNIDKEGKINCLAVPNIQDLALTLSELDNSLEMDDAPMESSKPSSSNSPSQ